MMGKFITFRIRLFIAVLLSAVLILPLFQACTGKNSAQVSNDTNNANQTEPAPPEEGPLSLESKILETRNYTDWNGATAQFHLTKLRKKSHRDAYVQYIPPSPNSISGTNTCPCPILVATMPYEGISWADNEIDKKWASRPNAATGYSFADEDSIGYQAGISKNVTYILTPPENAAANVAVYKANGAAVLLVYGRFYRGSTIQDLIDDMDLAFEFVSQLSEIDHSRVGLVGTSLGGFMASHGAAHTNPAWAPKFGVLFAPALDFADVLNFHLSFIPANISNSAKIAEHKDFMDLHIRRSTPLTGGLLPFQGGDFSSYNGNYLKNHLTGKFLVMHDEWDTMVPLSSPTSIINSMPSVLEPFWYLHSTAPNYNTLPVSHDPDSPNSGRDGVSEATFSQTYLINKLFPTASISIATTVKSDLDLFFGRLRALQQGGRDISFMKARFIELANANLYLKDPTIPDDANNPMPARKYLSILLNKYWGTSTTENNVKAYLETNGIPN